MAITESQTVREIEQAQGTIVGTALALDVADQDSYGRACALLMDAVRLKQQIEAYWKVKKAHAFTTWKELCRAEQEMLEPLEQAAAALKPRIAAFDREQRARQAEEQRRLEAEERRRLEDEQVAEAATAEAAGDRESAEMILAAPPAPVVIAAPPCYQRVHGVSTVERWHAEVTDLVALAAAVGAGQQPTELLLPNQAALNRLAAALKSALAVPGVRAVRTDTARVRAR